MMGAVSRSWIGVFVLAATLVISACGDEDELAESNPGRDLKRITTFQERDGEWEFAAYVDKRSRKSCVVGRTPYPVALDARGRRVRG